MVYICFEIISDDLPTEKSTFPLDTQTTEGQQFLILQICDLYLYMSVLTCVRDL